MGRDESWGRDMGQLGDEVAVDEDIDLRPEGMPRERLMSAVQLKPSPCQWVWNQRRVTLY